MLVDTFLSLVRLGIGNASTVRLPKDVDWNALEDLAVRHGLSAVIVDGIERLPDSHKPPKPVLLQWIGETLQGYEYRYEQYRKAIAGLASFYNKHGFRMMLLKGYACSLDWPRPDHRPCGDIDIWQFGQQKDADAALEVRFKGLKIDNSHHHHSIFYWQDFMVENHYDFIDVHHRRSGPKLEAIFKELGQDDSRSIDLCGEKVYMPCVNLHALFLVYHTMLHFTSTEMNIRQILDWGMFVRSHTNEIDWDWLLELVAEFHLCEFLNILNAICVEELGFDPSIFRGVKYSPELKERVLRDTFEPEFSGREPAGFLHRIWFRYRRWKSHEWKHKICFEESMWSIFWGSVWSHILKPKSI